MAKKKAVKPAKDNVQENSEKRPVAETYDFVIEKDDAGVRIDLFLGRILNDYSRTYVQKLIEKEYVSINGSVTTLKKQQLKENDKVVIGVPEPEALSAEPEDIPIEIVYEDDDVIVVNKPQGMVVHPAVGNPNGTLVNAVLYHSKSLSSINGTIRPGIVHRIDKDTSGLLMIAKNNNAHQSLAAQLKDHSINRTYQTIVVGNMKSDEGTVDAPIARNPKDRMKMAVVPGGKEARTNYRVLERFKGYTLVECRLETGRTHQIRVHMAHIGHPVLGDGVYNMVKTKVTYSKGQLLHAKTLGFIHPTKNEYMEFDSELPEYFKEILLKIKSIG